MASSHRKAPSAGQKVNPGREAPVTQEGAGPVAPESLAAESMRSEGAYAANVPSGREGQGQGQGHGMREEKKKKTSEGASAQHVEHAEGLAGSSSSHDTPMGAAGSSSTRTTRAGKRETQAEAEAAREQGAQAPTYVVDQYLQDRGGPHGRNITEDERLGEGGEHGRAAEGDIGGEMDAGREAERGFALRREMKGRSAGARDEELRTGTRYDVLGGDRSA